MFFGASANDGYWESGYMYSPISNDLVCHHFDPKTLRAWTTHIIGSGSGSVTLTSMSGYSLGDTALITSGTYSYFNWANLDSITIMAQDTTNQPIFSQPSSSSPNRYCLFQYMKFIYGSGSTYAWDISTKQSYHNTYAHLYFYGWGLVFQAHNNNYYTSGDTTTLLSYKDVFHDIISDSCGQFMQASYGAISSNSWSPPDVFDSTTFYNIQDIATSLQGTSSGQGTGIRGIFFRMIAHDFFVTDRSGRPATGDVGYFYLTGGGAHIWNIYKWGGPGYIFRDNDPMAENAHPFDIWAYNCGKFGGTEYGEIQIQAILADTLVNKYYGPNAYLWNLTMGNQFNDTTNNYFSPLINLGQITVKNGVNQHYYCWNIFGFSIGENQQQVGDGPNQGKNQIWVNLGGWNTYGSDTSNGKYYHDATLASLDSTTNIYTNRIGSFKYYKLTSASPNTLLHAGITSYIASPTADLNGALPRTPPDLGYLQLVINTCNCHPRYPGRSGGAIKFIAH
jgi:hypothetical protein